MANDGFDFRQAMETGNAQPAIRELAWLREQVEQIRAGVPATPTRTALLEQLLAAARTWEQTGNTTELAVALGALA